MTVLTKHRDSFERTWPGRWNEFCRLVNSPVSIRPHIIRKQFSSLAGNPMSKPSFYKWEARAKQLQEVK